MRKNKIEINDIENINNRETAIKPNWIFKNKNLISQSEETERSHESPISEMKRETLPQTLKTLKWE